MARKFAYHPKFVDIRVKPPQDEEKVEARPKSSAKAKKAAAEKTCEHKGCERPAPCRAPKSRELNEYYWFCASHAAEYNRNWNFFQGMDDRDFKSFSESARTGHRPTWSMGADSGSREAQTARQKAAVDAAKVEDPFRLFAGRRTRRAPRPEPERRLNQVHLTALEELALDENADSRTIRLRYAELIKRFHPDSNGGDRSAEAKLNKVIKAYQVLKSAGLA
jgi:hypothetical protein